MVEEILSQAGVNGFLSNVMNAQSSSYQAGEFIDITTDSENAIFYKSAKFHFVDNKRIVTAVRDINEFTLVHLLSGDTVRIYAVHLKSSDTPDDSLKRIKEVDSLRKVTNALPPGSNFIVCGDFNMYHSLEGGYLRLKDTTGGNEGYFIDPITMSSNNWNNGSNAIRHTQSTRVTTYLNDGGSTGGMDDRFDMILYSKAISLTGGMTYVANSTIAYGNDGNHYNDSINKMPNSAVSQTIAEALYHCSDHIPIIASFKFQYGSSSPPDVGVLSLVSPVSPACSNANQSLQVQVKNFGTGDVNFSAANLQVQLTVTNPSSSTQNFSKTISSGTLSGGAVMNITFDTPYNMSSAGNYIFNSNTIITGDVNNANNSMAPVTVVVNANPAAIVSPAGPLSICSGSSATLTASAGTGFQWSTGATTQSISVNTAGNHSVTVTSANGCTSTSAAVVVSVISGQASVTLFSETMGNPAGTTSIATHETNNGFDNDNFFMYGTGEIRITNMSSGYATASGAANAFLTNTSAGKYFVISGINTTGKSNLELSFGVFKFGNASNGSDFSVQVSSDSLSYSTLTFPALPVGSSTWYYRTAAGTIPSVPNLRIRFRNEDTLTQFRIDDVLLKYTNTPVITAGGPTTFCQGDSVTLTATAGTNYVWNNGATTQSIKVNTSGNYSVTVDCVPASPVTVTVNNFTINSSAGSNGTINPNGVSTNCGTNRTYTITPNTCYHIADVLVDGVSNAGAITAGTYTFNNVMANHTINATFAINQYTITSSAGPNGTINPNGPASVNCGGSKSYTFTPNSCYHIANVLVDGVSNPGAVSAGTYTFNNVIANHSISVTFAINQYTITSSAAANGTINPIGATSVNCGSNNTYAITPNACYHIVDVLIDNVSNAGAVSTGTYTFNNVTGNHTISAVFAINQYTITSSAGAGGSIAPGGASPVNCGNNLSFSITADSCRQIEDVLVDGLSNANAISTGSYTFNNINGNHTISATFTGSQCNVTLNLKLFFEGFYSGNGEMQAVLYNNGLSSDPTACDSILVELRDPILPDSVIVGSRVLLHTDGNSQILFPSSVLNNSYYLVVHHRNSVEIWSKDPMLFDSSIVNFDFTSQ